MMDRFGIDKALASVSPIPSGGPPDVELKWSRPINEFLANLVRNNPSRYGAFGVLPLRNADEALKEAAYVIDELRLDGFVLPTSVDGQYLGQERFDAILDYLHARKSVVFVHPLAPPGSDDEEKSILMSPTVEYILDTTRAISNLLFTGTFDRCRGIRFIFAHAGGAAPYAAGRLKLFAESRMQPGTENMQRGVIETMQSLYFDLALSAFPYSLNGLTELVAPTHLLFGSDAFRATDDMVRETLHGMRRFRGFDASDLSEVERGTALRLFPRLKTV